MKAVALALYERIKRLRYILAIRWPYGYLCRFPYGADGEIRLNKQMWIIVTDGKSQDALPINFVSPALVKRCGEELAKKWYWPATAVTPEQEPVANAQ